MTADRPFFIYYDSIEAGWAEIVVGNGTRQSQLSASYLTDAPADLISSVTDLCRGSSEARVSCMEEPGEYRWVLTAVEAGALDVRIVFFPGWEAPVNAEPAALIRFQCTTTVLEFARAVSDASHDILDRLGLESYTASWGRFPFPEAHLALLDEAIALYASP